MVTRQLHSIIFAFCVSFTFLLGACATTSEDSTNLKRIYDKSAQYHRPDRNPVIVIPGILGSTLVDEASGKTVWGAFRSDYADPNSDEGARLVALPLTTDLSESHYVQTEVRPAGVLESIKADLAGIPISIQAYSGILTTLGAGGYLDESLGLNSVDYGTDHYTCFQFDYDWRQDIPTNAARLKAFIDEKRADVQRNYKRDFGIDNAEVKFDIVAHSMGGLLTRYFARYGDADIDGLTDGVVPWTGAQDVERLILVAPPNGGSLEAMDQLLNGFNTGRPVLPYYHPALIGTFPSVYQLLPRSRNAAFVWNEDVSDPVEDILDPDLWESFGWGLSGQDKGTDEVLERLMPSITSVAERRRFARRFQRDALDRAKDVQRVLDIPAKPPRGIELFLVAGDNNKTPSIASIDKATGDYSVLDYNLVDETVTRDNALQDERVGQIWEPRLVSPIKWDATMFIAGKHRNITSGRIFEDNVLYWLLEDPRE